MAKKVFAMYLAKEGNPNSDAYAKLDLPASPWELWDALEKVRLQTDDILYMEIEDYGGRNSLRAENLQYDENDHKPSAGFPADGANASGPDPCGKRLP